MESAGRLMAKKPDWLYRQSAAIPIFGGKIVLVTSRGRSTWTVPKGVIERTMTPWDSAAKEALEEAGVVGQVETDAIGSYSYEKWGGECVVQVYRLHVESLLDEWEEMDQRERVCIAPNEAPNYPLHSTLTQLIQTALL